MSDNNLRHTNLIERSLIRSEILGEDLRSKKIICWTTDEGNEVYEVYVQHDEGIFFTSFQPCYRSSGYGRITKTEPYSRT